MATKLRAVCAVALLVGFYLVGLVMLAGMAWLVAQFWGAFGGGLATDVGGAAIALAVVLALPAWQVLRARLTPPDGVRLGETQAPELWRLVRDVADALGTRLPDEICLVAVVNAMVWEDAGRVGLRRGRRYLYLGVPLLNVLTVAQVRAIVAHELGHYQRGHTVFGAVVYRGGQSILRTVEGVGSRLSARLVLAVYAHVYFAVALALIRRMETEADRAAVRLAGAQSTAEALDALPRLVAAWDAAMEGCVDLTRDQATTPAEMLAAFDSFVASDVSPVLRWTWTSGTATDEAPTSRWDSHPPLAERLRLITAIASQEPRPAWPDDLRPATALVADDGAVLAMLNSEEFTGKLALIAQGVAEKSAEKLYAAAAEVAGIRRRGLGSVLDILECGGGDALALAVTPTASSPDTGDRLGPLTESVVAAVGASLVDAGLAGAVFSWAEPLSWRSAADGEPLEMWPLVEAACADPQQVKPLRACLRGWGVEESVTARWAMPGVAALDSGLPAGGDTAERSDSVPLLLPDHLLLLVQQFSGRSRPDGDVLDAGLAAAALAELRLSRRIELTQGKRAVVHVCDPTPIGDRFLDSVLARIGAGGAEPAYRWLQMIGSDVGKSIEERLRGMGRHWAYNEQGRYTLQYPQRDAAVQAAHARLVAALRAGEDEGSAVLLGMLLWGIELLKPVIGRSMVVPRFWLGRLAARDPLMVAIRTVTGLYMPLPTGGTSGY